jgi:hypothetical protein
MKVVITESQYRKLQNYVRKQELNEASLGKKLGMTALGAGLALGSPEAKGQDYDYVRSNSDSTNQGMTQSRNIEPTGRFTFPTDYGGKKDRVVVDSNIVNVTSPTQIADILQMVFTQYDSLEIPINRKNIDETNFILQNVIIDSSYGGQNLDGYYFVPKGVRSEDDILKSPFLKKIWGVLKGVFGENVRLPIKKVRMDNSVVLRFIKLVEAEKTPFGIKTDRNGNEVIYKEFDFN